MTWLRKVNMCPKCAPGPYKGGPVTFAKRVLCNRIGCDDLVDGYKNQCVPSADEESCLEYVEESTPL